MDPQQQPTGTPVPEQNPYDFFMTQGNQPAPQRFNIPKGNSSWQRILIFVGGGAVVLILIVVIFSFLTGGNSAKAAQLVELAQEQTEIMRIANLANTERSAQNSTKNLANNTLLSVSTTHQDVIAMLNKGGKKVNAKELGLKQNTSTDARLSNAAQNNTYDSVFTEVIQTELKKYQAQLKTAYGNTTNAGYKESLNTAYKGVDLLLGTTATPN